MKSRRARGHKKNRSLGNYISEHRGQDDSGVLIGGSTQTKYLIEVLGIFTDRLPKTGKDATFDDWKAKISVLMCNKLKWTGLLDGNEAGEKLFSVKGTNWQRACWS